MAIPFLLCVCHPSPFARPSTYVGQPSVPVIHREDAARETMWAHTKETEHQHRQRNHKQTQTHPQRTNHNGISSNTCLRRFLLIIRIPVPLNVSRPCLKNNIENAAQRRFDLSVASLVELGEPLGSGHVRKRTVEDTAEGRLLPRYFERKALKSIACGKRATDHHLDGERKRAIAAIQESKWPGPCVARERRECTMAGWKNVI